MTTNKAVIYCRVSSDKQLDKSGLSSQALRCHEYAVHMGWQVIGTYYEKGVSGGLLDRPAMNEMRHFLESQNGNTYVIVDDIARWANENRYQGCSLGILLGPLSNELMCIDLDGFTTEMYEIADKILPHTEMMAGKGNDFKRHRFYKIITTEFGDNDLPNKGTITRSAMDEGKLARFAGRKSYKNENNGVGIDFIGAGGQVGVAPCYYGNRIYRGWYSGEPLKPAEVDYYELKRAVEKLFVAIGGHIKSKKKVIKKSSNNNQSVIAANNLRSDFDGYCKAIKKSKPAISGQGGQSKTFAACCLAGDYNISIEKAWPVLQEYNQGCEPPWDEDELHKKLEDSYLSRQSEIGCKVLG